MDDTVSEQKHEITVIFETLLTKPSFSQKEMKDIANDICLLLEEIVKFDICLLLEEIVKFDKFVQKYFKTGLVSGETIKKMLHQVDICKEIKRVQKEINLWGT